MTNGIYMRFIGILSERQRKVYEREIQPRNPENVVFELGRR